MPRIRPEIGPGEAKEGRGYPFTSRTPISYPFGHLFDFSHAVRYGRPRQKAVLAFLHRQAPQGSCRGQEPRRAVGARRRVGCPGSRFLNGYDDGWLLHLGDDGKGRRHCPSARGVNPATPALCQELLRPEPLADAAVLQCLPRPAKALSSADRIDLDPQLLPPPARASVRPAASRLSLPLRCNSTLESVPNPPAARCFHKSLSEH